MLDGNPNELPPLAAVFLIVFDNRVGYTVKWHRSMPDVEVEGVVEYKSLPSGLHHIKEDLIYFIHNDLAGLSAFYNEPASESERNAHMVAVGILVPLRYGRLGKAWRHALELKDLVRHMAGDTAQTGLLEGYWEQHRLREADNSEVPDSPFASPAVSKFKESPTSQTNGRAYQIRTRSDSMALSSPQTLPPYHPALSLPEFIATFGPLMFPLYRAALLRKRVLIIGEAPVQLACNFVYILSIISNIPLAVQAVLPNEPPPLRLRPLFNIGVHDIPLLEELSRSHLSWPDESDASWVACTTDNVLATKTDLYDILVTLPPPYSKNAPSKVYPKITTPHPPPSKTKPSKKRSHDPYPSQYPLKATQRDARRYVTLRRGLRRLPRSDPIFPFVSSLQSQASSSSPIDNTDALSTTSSTTPSILEPLSWPLFAYNSFIWWASAGETRPDLEEESKHDTDLLFADIDNLAADGGGGGATIQPIGVDAAGANSTSTLEVNQHHPHSRRSRGKSIGQIGFRKGTPVREMALVAYFHRLTTLMFSTLVDIIARQDADDDDEDTGSNLLRHNDDTEEDQAVATGSHISTSNILSSTEPSGRNGRNGRATTGKKGKSTPEEGRGRADGDEDRDAEENEPLLSREDHHHHHHHRQQEEEDEEILMVTAEDVSTMGLDVWSEADRCFIEDVAGLWFGRRARVKGGRVECCGIRIY